MFVVRHRRPVEFDNLMTVPDADPDPSIFPPSLILHIYPFFTGSCLASAMLIALRGICSGRVVAKMVKGNEAAGWSHLLTVAPHDLWKM
jgi:hypothetical protein